MYGAAAAAILYFLAFGDGIGQKLLGVWIPILICLPICWLFGEPLSQGDQGKRVSQ